jgi:hypothetical protein
MFRRDPLSIIRGFSLYTQQWYVSYRLLTACDQDQDGTAVTYIIILYITQKNLRTSVIPVLCSRNAGANLISEIECSRLLEIFLSRFKVILATSAPPHIPFKFIFY